MSIRSTELALLFLAVPSCRHVCLDINHLREESSAVSMPGLMRSATPQWCVNDPRADHFRSAAADIACADRSLFAAMESNGNYFAALHNQRLRRKSGFTGSMICNCANPAALSRFLRKVAASATSGSPFPQVKLLHLLQGSKLLATSGMLMLLLPPFKRTTSWSTSYRSSGVRRVMGERTIAPYNKAITPGTPRNIGARCSL